MTIVVWSHTLGRENNLNHHFFVRYMYVAMHMLNSIVTHSIYSMNNSINHIWWCFNLTVKLSFCKNSFHKDLDGTIKIYIKNFKA